MTVDDRMRRAALSTAGLDSIRRSAVPGGADVPDADSATAGGFDLHYTRTGPRGGTPVVVIPGGPGLASVWPYRSFRKRAARRELDVIMIEHRGVGLSRRDLDGNDLRPEAMTLAAVVDDLEAALPTFDFPVLAMVGDRDLRTPRPVAEHIVALAPRGRLVVIRDHGHSALDTNVEPLLVVVEHLVVGNGAEVEVDVAVAAALGTADRQRRRGGPSRHLGRILSVLLRIDRVMPRLRRR